jgi:hypothetical protein
MATANGYFDTDAEQLVGEADRCHCGAFLTEHGACPDCGA